MKPTNALCGQNTELYNVKEGGTRLKSFKELNVIHRKTKKIIDMKGRWNFMWHEHENK